jgi:hypothetical protein
MAAASARYEQARSEKAISLAFEYEEEQDGR